MSGKSGYQVGKQSLTPNFGDLPQQQTSQHIYLSNVVAKLNNDDDANEVLVLTAIHLLDHPYQN